MSSPAWPALLAGAAVAAATLLPRPADVRLGVLARGDLPAGPAPGRRWVTTAGLVLGLLVGAGLLSGSGVVLPLGGAACLLGHLAWRRTCARRLQSEERRRAAEACLALASELRAGRVPAEALRTAAELARGPSHEALVAAAAAARLGGDVPAAVLSGVGATAAPEVLRGLAACWQVCSRAGAGLAAGVDRLAEGLRSAQAQERAVEAALAGPRASAALLALLPLAGIALAAALGARPGHVLLHTSLGVACLVSGCALDALGVWWTARLVDRAGRVR